ncbi:hypothetical protein PRIPAC_73479 [Pristionchus pacificus]|nr:hypothetical protein PRIPAC_73479 [Pristionchus pacificus]|eukprot:PDM64355.1 hypothetical protein PRIPAC_52611 [Pristionchus pacificus]
MRLQLLQLVYCSLLFADEEKDFFDYLYRSARKASEQETAKINEEAAPNRPTRNEHEPVIEQNPPIRLPGDYQPLPGRTSYGDYWPLYPFSNQYHEALTIDPSSSRHMGGDIIAPVPYWGLIDISGHFIERVHDYAHRIAYINNPINMLGIQPKLPLGMIPKAHAPLNCAPPLCNPYVHTFAIGFEQDEPTKQDGIHTDPVTEAPEEGGGEHGGGEGEHGGEEGHDAKASEHGETPTEHEEEGEGEEHHNPFAGLFHVDGYEGQFDMAVPVGKGIAYRVPVSGNIYFDRDNITMTYGQHTGPIDSLRFMPGDYAADLDVSRPRSLVDRTRLPEFNDIMGGPRRSKRAAGYDSRDVFLYHTVLPEFEGRSRRIRRAATHDSMTEHEDEDEEEKEEDEEPAQVSPLAFLFSNRVTPQGEQLEYLHNVQKLAGSTMRIEPKNDILVRLYNEQIRGLERVAEAWKDYKVLWGADPYEEENVPNQP